MNYKAVIFDLDGTLINTLADLARSTNQALRQFALPEHPVESYRVRIGDGTRTMIARSVPSDRQELVDDVRASMAAHYKEHFADTSRPYDGVAEMLKCLRDKGMPLAVLTNKQSEYAVGLVEKFFAGLFEMVLGDSVDYPLKPDPTSALAIAAKMGVTAEETAFLGDTAVDMETAVAAKMFAVGALWGFRDRAELVASGAQAIMDQPGQFAKLLEAGGVGSG